MGWMSGALPRAPGGRDLRGCRVMFDIGFSKIVLIFGLALVVLGPEKLPRVAATVGRWVGRARVMAKQFRDQLEQESEGLRKETDGLREAAEGLRRDLDPNASAAP